MRDVVDALRRSGHDLGVTRKVEREVCEMSASTLDATDVASGWTELRAVRDKAEVHALEAMRAIRARMPFELLGIDSDNGSVFISSHFLRYCESEDLVFTRERPYTKNDGCFVEERNWSVVRRAVGYARYEGDEACAVMNETYDR